MENATTRLLDLLRASQGGCTDYRVAQLLGVTRSTVSRWRTGEGHMSEANIMEAAKHLGPRFDVGRAMVFIGAEREKGPDGEYYRRARRDFEIVESGGTLPDDSLLRIFIEGLNGKVAAILASVGLALAMVLAPVKPATAATFSADNCGPVYTLCEVRIRRRRRAAWSILPRIRALFLAARPLAIVMSLATVSGCATLRDPAEMSWQALHLVDTLQTEKAVADPCFQEGESAWAIGHRPNDATIAAWSIATAAGHAGISHWLDATDHPKLKRAWQYLTLAHVGYNVGNNFTIGIRIGSQNRTPAGCIR